MQYLWFKVHIVKLMLNHFNVKLYYFVFYQSIKTVAYYRTSTIFSKIFKFKYFLPNTINIIAQFTAVFSTIAHLLFHNRCQFFSHFLMVIGAIHPIHSTKCLNNWFEVLSTCVTLIQTLVPQLIGTNKQAINSS